VKCFGLLKYVIASDSRLYAVRDIDGEYLAQRVTPELVLKAQCEGSDLYLQKADYRVYVVPKAFDYFESLGTSAQSLDAPKIFPYHPTQVKDFLVVGSKFFMVSSIDGELFVYDPAFVWWGPEIRSTGLRGVSSLEKAREGIFVKLSNGSLHWISQYGLTSERWAPGAVLSYASLPYEENDRKRDTYIIGEDLQIYHSEADTLRNGSSGPYKLVGRGNFRQVFYSESYDPVSGGQYSMQALFAHGTDNLVYALTLDKFGRPYNATPALLNPILKFPVKDMLGIRMYSQYELLMLEPGGGLYRQVLRLDYRTRGPLEKLN